MANKVTIDIEAKFVDNASAGIDALSAKVDALNGKKVTINSGDVGSVVTVGDKMTKSAEETSKQAQNTIQYYQKGQSIAEKTISSVAKATEQTQKMLNATAPKSAEIKSYAIPNNTTLALPAASISSYSEYGEKIVNDIQDGFTKGVNRNQSDLSDVINRSIDNMFKQYEPSEYSPDPSSFINPNAASTATDRLRGGSPTIDGAYSKDAFEYVFDRIPDSELDEIISATHEKSKETASAVGEAVSKTLNESNVASSQFDVGAFARAVGSATGNTKYTTMAGRMADALGETLDEASSENARFLKGLTTSIATAQMIQGVSSGLSNIVEGAMADNSVDSARSMWRGGTSLGLTGVGALIGTLIAPGAGTLIGGGIGSTVDSLFGDTISNTLSGMKKSWSELTEDAINKYFGGAILSNEQIAYMVNRMRNKTAIQEDNGFSSSLSNLMGYRTSLQSSANNIKLVGSQIEILDNMELPNDESNLTSFTSAVKDFGQSAMDYLSMQMFNELSAADDLLGSGNSLVEPVSEKYSAAIRQIQDIQKKATDYIDIAMKDNELSTPEVKSIIGFKDSLQNIINDYTQDVTNDQINGLKFLASQGSLSKESFDGVLNSLNSSFGDIQMQYATEMATNIRNGWDKVAAVKDYYSKLAPELDNYASNATEFAQNFMSNDLIYDRRTTNEAFASAMDPTFIGEGAEMLVNIGNMLNSTDNLRGVLGIDKSNYSAGISYESQAAYSTLYDSLNNSGIIKTLENSANMGQATQTQMNSLMSLYEIGAYGGNEHAMQGYFGMKMAQSEQTKSWMDALIQNQPNSVPEAVKDAFNWAMGRTPNVNTVEQPTPASEQTTPVSEQTTPVSGQTEPVADDEQNKNFSQKDIVSDFDEMEKTVPESGQTGQIDTSNLAQNVMDSLNSSFQNMSASDFGEMPIGQTIMSGISDSLTNMSAEQFGQLDIGKDIMNSINSSFQNIDASQMGDLDIGKTIMDKIGDSMTNMNAEAFGDLNIGQNIMDVLNAQLSNVDISGMDFNIGESLMSKINEGLMSVDINGEFMSNLNIGESIMNSLNSSLANVSVESVDLSGIGANVSSSLINSLSSIDVSAAGEIITSQISGSLSSISVEPTINIIPIYQIVDGGAGLQEQLMSSISAASIETTVTVNVTYGIESSAADSYTPQDKTATVVYGLDSSAVDGWQPPNKTATVTYNIVTLGSLPHFASGTDYMAYNSMATINDQASAANPQELVVHDGRGYLFDGRNVQIPLSQGDRVFTASQTQRMLQGNFAGGYDNYEYEKGDYVQEYFNQYLNGGDDNTPQLDYGSGPTVSIDGASVTIGNIEFKVENKGDGRDVVETLKDNCDEVAEALASVLEKRLGDEFRNTPTKI